MSNPPAADSTRETIRKRLLAEKVKLWLPPYTTEFGQKGEEPTELIKRYSQELQITEDIVAETFEALRQHAVDRLARDRQFRENGLATLHIKLAGQIPAGQERTEISLETSLRISGSDLKRQLCVECHVDPGALKLVTSGRVINDDVTLQEQAVQHNSRIMALCLSATQSDAVREQERAVRLARARQAAEWMTSREDDGSGYYMQIADQSGRPIDLPKDERKALTLAMVFHEKGRAALKRREFAEALLYLLEADGEFNKCRASVLTVVDNYALVCLDICWCYLCLRNISSLHDAERRLRTCDECFVKSYGANLERLAIVKGGTGEEMALFVRLHLLQAILAYHQGHQADAERLLLRVETELSQLRTSESDMQQVMLMGFTESEARLGLRTSGGDVQGAVAHIVNRREEKRLQAEKDKETRKHKQLEHSLGKTASNQRVNIDLYKNLVSMGFGKGAAAEALRQSNNDLNLALQTLQDRPELLSLPDPDPPKFKVTDEMIQQVAALGFDVETVRAALHHFHANVGKVVDELVQRGGIVPVDWHDSVLASTTSSSTSMSTNSSSSSHAEDQQLAESEIIPDLADSTEDYLDLLLDDEASFLEEYKTLLASMS